VYYAFLVCLFFFYFFNEKSFYRFHVVNVPLIFFCLFCVCSLRGFALMLIDKTCSRMLNDDDVGAHVLGSKAEGVSCCNTV
jgi:uncharacterized membrane protein